MIKAKTSCDNPIKIHRSLFLFPLICIFSWFNTCCYAQTYVTSGTMTGTPAPGAYYNNNSIVLTNFSFTPSPGNSLNIYITPDCSPLLNNLSGNQNYILTSTPRQSGMTSIAGFSGQGTCQLMQTIQYFDGLGRPLQNVQVKGSPMGSDVVQPIAYDPLGREVQKYLNYAANSADGSYKTDALTPGAGIVNYYNPGGNGISGSQQSNGVVINPSPYALVNFEPSPLNRIVEQGAPGADWQPVSGSTAGHTLKIIYGSNDAASTSTGTGRWARSYSVTIDPNTGLRGLVDNGSGGYTANTLYVTVTEDENWKSGQPDARLNTTEQYQYKDLEGHVVLKRTYNLNTSVTPNQLQILSTYYVYDDFCNLAFVLPPGASPDNGLSSAANQATLNSLCYQYNYDSRQRLVSKQLPGKGVEEIVYNLLDKPIFNRDARMAGLRQWGFIKYDVHGRVIMTGIETNNSSTRQALQSYVTNTLAAPSSTVPEWEIPNPVSGVPVQGYSNSCFPTSGSVVPLRVNYYDNYNFQGQPASVIAPAATSTMTRDLVTATKTAVLNNVGISAPDMLWTVHYYDDLGRSTQNYAQHYLGGTLNANNYDVSTITYNFDNQPVTTTRQHYNTGSTTNAALTVANSYTYDHVGHKTQTFEQINGGTNVLLSQQDYNEIGQVKTKHLYSTNVANGFLQNIAYTYNERSWLSASSAQLFALQLEYNSNPGAVPGFTAQYNGNIASQIYTSFAQPTKNYVYGYDYLNRLTSGISSDNYNESGITYDLMGNIATLSRSQAGTVIDNLVYTYSGNQVQGINDLSADNSQYGYRPGNYTAYHYDVNGNMDVLPTPPDHNPVANINIQYNLLNLPQTITGGRTITYTYDAAGNKLRRVSPNTGSTDYIGGIQYDQPANATSPSVSFVQTEEGKAVPISGGYDYYYYLSDNLGNTRVTFDTKSGAAAMLQQDDYYPFGYEISRGIVTNPKNEYLYNKKELQEELQQLDYGARFYDPVIARWNTIDPLAEISRRWSPYNYVENNPIRLIDPDGMSAKSDSTDVGADGLTNDQWTEASRPGANSGLKAMYQAQNKEYEQEAKADTTGKGGSTKSGSGANQGGDPPGSWQRVKDYLANVWTAGKNTAAWYFGFADDGLSSRVKYYKNDRVANAMRNSPGIDIARNLFYNSQITYYHYDFGLLGLSDAGSNPIQQFVGSYDVYTKQVNGLLQFTILNVTSVSSFSLHLTSPLSNPTSGPMGNVTQYYIFTEPLRK